MVHIANVREFSQIYASLCEYGPDFERDLEYFHDLLNRTSEACIDHKRRNIQDKRVVKFVLKPTATSFCVNVLRGDVGFTGLIRSKMKHMYGFNEKQYPKGDSSRHLLMPSKRYSRLRNPRTGTYPDMLSRARIRPPIRRGPLMQRMVGMQRDTHV